MKASERVKRVLNRLPVDRIPVYDSFWTDTERDFRSQGVPEESTLADYFGFDFGMFWFEQSFLLPTENLAEEDGKKTFRDSWGATNVVFIDKQTSPGLLDFAVSSSQVWEKDYKEKLVYHPERIDWEALQKAYDNFRAKDRYTVLSMLDPFECGWHMVGPETQLKLMIKDPGWLTDMYESSTRLIEQAWEDLQSRGVEPDGLWLYGDIAYKNGPMFSPRHYQELLMPFHARLVDLAHASGAQVIYHSDGDLSRFIPHLIEIGVDCLHPLEVKAGMDVVKLKEEYGSEITLMGNIDARLFEENDLAGLEKELRRKIPAAMEGGGYMYHSDHSIPPGTKLSTYQFALELVRELGRY